MKTEIISESKPPYVAFKTFTNFIANLRASGLPNRIDRSVFSGVSGANQSFLLATLKFLALINNDGVPTASFKDLIENPANEKAILSKAAKEKYNFIFDGFFNITSATTAQLTEKFRDRGIEGSTIVKALSFFTALCEATGIQTSPHLKGKRGPSGSNGVARRPYKKRKLAVENEVDSTPEKPLAHAPKTFQEILLSKFPDFNPTWDAETQKKWFDNFEKFMASVKKPEQ